MGSIRMEHSGPEGGGFFNEVYNSRFAHACVLPLPQSTDARHLLLRGPPDKLISVTFVS